MRIYVRVRSALLGRPPPVHGCPPGLALAVSASSPELRSICQGSYPPDPSSTPPLTDEGTMKKKRARKATAAAKTPVQDLAPRNADKAKGGILSSAISEVMKNFGGALQTAARGG